MYSLPAVPTPDFLFALNAMPQYLGSCVNCHYIAETAQKSILKYEIPKISDCLVIIFHHIGSPEQRVFNRYLPTPILIISIDMYLYVPTT